MTKVNQIQVRVLEQCKEYLGFQPQCFQISNKLYQQGIQKHKDGLIRNSHIEELLQHIQTVAKDIQLVRQERFSQEKSKLLQALNEKKSDVESELKIQELDLISSFESFQKSLKDLKQFVETKAQQYKKACG